MAISPEVRKLLQQTLKIRDSHVPLHRVIDILATEDGDVSQAVNRFRDIKNQELRRAFHNCALLLRELEKEAGLQPTWEQSATSKAIPASGSLASGGTGTSSSKSSSSAPAEPKKTKLKYSPEDLRSFEDDSMRNQVRVAKVYVDGASKGNPGDSGIGIALMTMEGKVIAQISRFIGTGTNNNAEYTALNEGLDLAKRMGVKVLSVISDSELMVKQMNGVYKIKNPDILKKVQEAKGRIKAFEKFTISWVGREHNALADALSTASLPKKPKAGPGESGPGADEHEDVLPPLSDTLDEGSTE